MNIKLLWSILIDALNNNKMSVVSVQFISLTDMINMCQWVVQRHNKSYGNNIQYLIFQSHEIAVLTVKIITDMYIQRLCHLRYVIYMYMRRRCLVLFCDSMLRMRVNNEHDLLLQKYSMSCCIIKILNAACLLSVMCTQVRPIYCQQFKKKDSVPVR